MSSQSSLLTMVFLGLALSLPGFNGWTNSPEQSGAASSEAAVDQEDAKEFVGSIVYLDRKMSYFQVSLPENPSTGFRCYLAKYDAQLLEPLSSSYVAGKAAVDSAQITTEKEPENKAQAGEVKSLVGIGGVRTFVFQIKPVFHNAPQKTKLEFRYDRPWASGEKGLKKVITVYSS